MSLIKYVVRKGVSVLAEVGHTKIYKKIFYANAEKKGKKGKLCGAGA